VAFFLAMIVVDESKGLGTPFQAQFGPSNIAAPPTFEESADHVVLDSSPPPNPLGFDDSPPEFAPYEADFFTLKNGWIVSHDPHLNQDGL
jgi:hypothetical protein